MSTDVQILIDRFTPDDLAAEITVLWSEFKSARNSWEQEMLEINAYIEATSTNTTEVNDNDFKNSTIIPKLAEIALNLQANYSAHLFSNPNWAQFEGYDTSEQKQEFRKVVEAYVRTKVRRKDYEGVFNDGLTDWIQTGVTFAQQRYVTEQGEDASGNPTILYQGCVLELIDPKDIVFDVTATSWRAARKIIKKIYTMGDIARMVKNDSNSVFTEEILEDMRNNRNFVRNGSVAAIPDNVDWESITLSRAGLGSILDYMKGDLVEVLEFYGDLYSVETGEFLQNHKIVVVDRTTVIYNKPIISRNGSQYLYYVGWENRAHNLMAMSPLARVVGMQYKLDKLENLRADIYDRIANPIIVETGSPDFEGVIGAPGGRYLLEEGEEVSYLIPDTTAIQFDPQMRAETLALMEVLVGSPRNATGFRTPGEKTKFEVQVLENGSNRIFRNKTHKYEREFIEPVLNDMVELAYQNLGDTDLVSTQGTEFDIKTFIEVTKSDLFISGKIRARGSRLFAEKATALQNLLGVMNNPGAMQLMAPHTSGKKLTKAVEDLADLQSYNIFTPNILVQEQKQTQRLAEQSGQVSEEIQAVNLTPASEGDLDE